MLSKSNSQLKFQEKHLQKTRRGVKCYENQTGLQVMVPICVATKEAVNDWALDIPL